MSPTRRPAAATPATAAALRLRGTAATTFAVFDALAIGVAFAIRTGVDSEWRFPLAMVGLAGLLAVPWAVSSVLRFRLVQQVLVGRPWVEHDVELHGTIVMVRKAGRPYLDGRLTSRWTDVDTSGGPWWVCSDSYRTFVVSPPGGGVLIPAKRRRR